MSACLRLAITKIGDLLLCDKITWDEDGNPIDGVKLVLPVYQRPYKWTPKNAIQLMDDILDAQNENLDMSAENKLTYRARKKSNDTIQGINNPVLVTDENDDGIMAGYKFAKAAIAEIVLENPQGFKDFFRHSVYLIRYIVPKDIDLNHYFEIMNSRGEQLEKHEIIKARLIEQLDNGDRAKFNRIWEFCSEMNVYIQQKYDNTDIFGKQHCNFIKGSFDELPDDDTVVVQVKIADLLSSSSADNVPAEEDKIDSFQPIMDFSNFLLLVLKLTRMSAEDFNPKDFNLDDKELINEFDAVQSAGLLTNVFVKQFGFNLLKAKYLLDNFVVHHSNEDDTVQSNPWKLQYWQKSGNKSYLKNLYEGDDQHKLVHLLSMFEVSFTARQRKNYLFYCLLYLFDSIDEYGHIAEDEYSRFVSGLADKYFYDVYLDPDNLNEINTPRPGAFDSNILVDNELYTGLEL